MTDDTKDIIKDVENQAQVDEINKEIGEKEKEQQEILEEMKQTQALLDEAKAQEKSPPK